MRCLSTFSGCGWAYGFTFSSLLYRHFLRFVRVRWNITWCKCANQLIEAVEPWKLYPMTISYIYEVFECLLRLWMGVWLHNHFVTTTDASPDLGKLVEILPDASVQTMPLCFGWGCRTFQTASHFHGIHIWEVWGLSKVVDGHMASHSHHYHHRCFPWFGEVGWNPTWCKCANHATTLWLRL